MRRFLIASATLVLAGCATAPQQVQPQPATQTVGEHGSLISMSADDLVRKFGTPALQIREGNSLKLQFRNPQCVLDAYLYPNGSEPYRVIHVDTRTRSMADVDQAFCIRALQSS